MPGRPDLPELLRVAESAADAARAEILPRFRRVAVEIKRDGSPVTEADRAAETAMRALLREATPEIGILGEEFGAEGERAGLCWLLDPIDGTISFSRGVPLFGTLVALLEDGEPVLGLIDLPCLDERIAGTRGGGVHCNGEPVRVSERADPGDAIIAHGDPYSFDATGTRRVYEAMARDLPKLRGYTDCFGHALVLQGGVDAMVDLGLNAWDAAATQLLAVEAGGRCESLDHAGRIGLVFGSPPLVEHLLRYFEA